MKNKPGKETEFIMDNESFERCLQILERHINDLADLKKENPELYNKVIGDEFLDKYKDLDYQGRELLN